MWLQLVHRSTESAVETGQYKRWDCRAFCSFAFETLAVGSVGFKGCIPSIKYRLEVAHMSTAALRTSTTVVAHGCRFGVVAYNFAVVA